MATTTEPRASFSLGQRMVGGVVGGSVGDAVQFELYEDAVIGPASSAELPGASSSEQ